MIRLCTGCVYYLPSGRGASEYCTHEMNMNPVSGGPNDSPYILRKRGDMCGVLASWFEPGVHPERIRRRDLFAKEAQEHAKKFAEVMVARAHDERLPDLYGPGVSLEEYRRRMARLEFPNPPRIPAEWVE